MSILQKIKNDQLASRKAKDKALTSILTTLLGEASRPGLDDGKRASTDAEVVSVCKKFIKNLEASLSVKESEILEVEKRVVESYLPKQLTNEEMTDIANDFIDENDEDCNMGMVMGFFKVNYAGLYNAGELAKIAKSLFN